VQAIFAILLGAFWPVLIVGVFGLAVLSGVIDTLRDDPYYDPYYEGHYDDPTYYEPYYDEPYEDDLGLDDPYAEPVPVYDEGFDYDYGNEPLPDDPSAP